jgi:hypothetical protein
MTLERNSAPDQGAIQTDVVCCEFWVVKLLDGQDGCCFGPLMPRHDANALI